MDFFNLKGSFNLNVVQYAEWLLRKRLANRLGNPAKQEYINNRFKLNIEHHNILGNDVAESLCLTGFHPTTVKFSRCYI